MKTELRGAAAGGGGAAARGLAAPAAAQTNCTTDGDLRQSPYCLQRAGHARCRAPPRRTASSTATNGDVTDAGRRAAVLSRADGEHATAPRPVDARSTRTRPGYLRVVVLQGIDARLVMEDVATGPAASAPTTASTTGDRLTTAKRLAVRGLEAGKTYLLQIGGRKRLSGAPDEGDFRLTAGFVPDRDSDASATPTMPARTSPPRAPRTGARRAPPAGGGGGGSPTPTPGGGHRAGRSRPGLATASAARRTSARARARAGATSTRTAARTASARDRRQVADRADERARRDHHARAAAERRGARARR